MFRILPIFGPLIILSFALSLEAKPLNEKSPEEVSGVLLQGQNSEEAFKGHALKDLLKKYHLTPKKYYPSFQTWQYQTEAKGGWVKPETLSGFCEEAKSIAGIKHCELNYKLKPQQVLGNEDQNSCTLPGVQLPIDANGLIKQLMPCELIPSQPPAPHGVEGLTTYWAQEYAGSDLLREELESLGDELVIPSNLIGVWDTDEEQHGVRVGQLIAGPTSSAVIPKKDVLAYENLEETSDYVATYEKISRSCQETMSCPNYINNSMSWKWSHLVEDSVRKVVEGGSVFVTAAGNESEEVETNKQNLEQEGKLIIVASSSPNGDHSKFSCYSPSVAVSAYSDSFVTSALLKGEPEKFGGTSGAAPQVTGALAAFTLISGVQLTTGQAKKLLERTSLPFPHGLSPSMYGAGTLNAFKVGFLAKKAALFCKGKERIPCVSELLESEKFYETSELQPPQKLFPKVASAFPECATSRQGLEKNFVSCQDKKEVLKELRKLVLLDPDVKAGWELLACIYKDQKYFKNAEYYTNMAARAGKTEADLIDQIMETKEGQRELALSLGHPYWKDHPEWVEELIQKGEVDAEIAQHVFSQSQWKNHPNWVEKLIEKGTASKEIAEYVLSQPQWKDHPELVEKLIEKGTVDREIAKWVLSQPQWKDHPELVEKLIEKGTVDLEIAWYVLSQPQWKDHPEWVEKLMQKGTVDNQIAIKVLSQPHWKDHPEWVEKIIQKGKADRGIARYVLNQPQWNDHPEWVEKLIQKGTVDEEIDEFVLSQPYWKDYYKKMFPELEEVTAKNIRELLKTK